jgi:predicted AAA+ superfamily ATPase
VIIIKVRKYIFQGENMQKVKRGDKNFEAVLDQLQKRYFHNGGSPDAEEIWNRNKREVTEDGVISLYATNSVISRAIKRNRKDIIAVVINNDGAEILYDAKAIRGGEYLIKPQK